MEGAMDEQAFIDGTHPSLHPTSNRPIRPDSPVSAHEDDSEHGEQERVSFITAPRASQTTAREANLTAPPPLVRHTSGAAASNTGPKGVIADFKAQQVHSSTSISRSLAQVSLSARPAPTVISLTSPTAVAEADDEQQALERYRQMRLEQLRGSGERAQGGGKAAAGRMFGHLREIGMDQFLGAIEEDYGVAVILHLYEPEFPACHVLNVHLSSLARSYPYTKFLRALASDLDFATSIEAETLPALLVYRHGELESTLIGIDREWGRGSEADVLEVLIGIGAINSSPTTPFSTSTQRRTPAHLDAPDDEQEE